MIGRLKVEHPFERTISIIKLIRKLKLDGGIPNKGVPKVVIKTQNNFKEFLSLVSSWEDIMYMEKIEEHVFIFNDTNNSYNDVVFQCTKENGRRILCSPIPKTINALCEFEWKTEEEVYDWALNND